jgi:hypothetical protein
VRPRRFTRERRACRWCGKVVSVTRRGLMAHRCPHRKTCVDAAALGPFGTQNGCKTCNVKEGTRP